MTIHRFSVPALLILAGATVLFGERSEATPATAAKGSYYRLKLVEIIDQQGFGQPVEVARLLLPQDWRVESGVRWDNSQLRCPANIIQVHLRAVAPDGITGFEVGPGYLWQAASDPMMQQVMRQQSAMGTGCDAGPVTGSIDYLRSVVVRRLRPGARVTSTQSLPEVAQAKQQLMAQSYGPLVQAGYVRGFRADSGSVQINYTQNGQTVEEWVTTTIQSVAMPSANTAALMQGQVNMGASVMTLYSDGLFLARAPAGQFDKKLFATIVASLRPNPQYTAAVSQFLANMSGIAQRGAMERSRIWQEAGQQISATINQTYRYQQAVQDRAAQQFSEAIRGVETYINPSTGSPVELAGGYTNAWVNNRGEYLLSDSPGFNPSVAFQEQWTALQKQR